MPAVRQTTIAVESANRVAKSFQARIGSHRRAVAPELVQAEVRASSRTSGSDLTSWPLPLLGGNRPYLEFESQTNLTFSSGQILYSAAKRRRRAFQALHRSGVPLIKKVEEFEQHLSLHALADVEALGHSHIHVDERRRSIDISRILRTLASEVETFTVE